jgi:hypothetical protein
VVSNHTRGGVAIGNITEATPCHEKGLGDGVLGVVFRRAPPPGMD